MAAHGNILSSASSSAFQTRNTSVRFIEHGERKYAPRISAEAWQKIRPILKALNDCGLTRAEMRTILITQHDLNPSIHQLNAKLIEWGITPVARIAKASIPAPAFKMEQMFGKNSAKILPEPRLATYVAEEQAEPRPASHYEVMAIERDSSRRETIDFDKHEFRAYSYVSNVSPALAEGPAPARHSDAHGDGINSLADRFGARIPRKFGEDRICQERELTERARRLQEREIEFHRIRLQTFELMADPWNVPAMDSLTSESYPIIGLHMVDALVASATKRPALLDGQASDVRQDIALFLSMIHCSSAAFHIYSNNIQLWLEQNRPSTGLPLRAVINCSRTANSSGELVIAHDMLKKAMSNLSLSVKLCHCIFMDLGAVLAANGWDEDYPGLVNQNYYAPSPEVKLAVGFRSNVHPCLFTPGICERPMFQNATSDKMWHLDDYVLSQLTPWATSQLGDAAALDVLQLCSEQALDTQHEILLTCYLTQKWATICLVKQTVVLSPSEAFTSHETGTAVAVQLFAVIANLVIKSLRRQLGPIIAKHLTSGTLRRCSRDALDDTPCERARQLAFVYRSLFIPDLDARQWRLKHIPPSQISGMTSYVRDTISMVATLAVMQQKTHIVNKTNSPAAARNTQIVKMSKVKAESVSDFSMSPLLICDHESKSMRSFRRASERARCLLQKLAASNKNFTASTPRLGTSHMSWNFNELTGFPELTQENVVQEPGSMMTV